MPLLNETIKIVIYSTYPWSQRVAVAMSDLAGETLLMLEDKHCLRNQVMNFCLQAGTDEDTFFRAISLEML